MELFFGVRLGGGRSFLGFLFGVTAAAAVAVEVIVEFEVAESVLVDIPGVVGAEVVVALADLFGMAFFLAELNDEENNSGGGDDGTGYNEREL